MWLFPLPFLRQCSFFLSKLACSIFQIYKYIKICKYMYISACDPQKYILKTWRQNLAWCIFWGKVILLGSRKIGKRRKARNQTNSTQGCFSKLVLGVWSSETLEILLKHVSELPSWVKKTERIINWFSSSLEQVCPLECRLL